jgi:hypothetical protein
MRMCGVFKAQNWMQANACWWANTHRQANVGEGAGMEQASAQAQAYKREEWRVRGVASAQAGRVQSKRAGKEQVGKCKQEQGKGSRAEG